MNMNGSRLASLIMGFALAFANNVYAAPLEQEVGAVFAIDGSDLPVPGDEALAANPPRTIKRPDGALPSVPAGFKVNLFADNLSHARWMALAPNGDIFLAEANRDLITVLRDADGDGRAEVQSEFHRGLNDPHGMAFYGDMLFISDKRAVWKFDYTPGDLVISGAIQPVTRPGAIGSAGSHWTRNLAIDPNGEHIFVAVGSMSNVAEEAEPHAAVKQFSLDGSASEIFASGLRNPVGISFYPGTDDLYVVVNERDMLGDQLVPDYLTRIQQGEFFGWPYAYIGGYRDPDFGDLRPDLVAATVMPDLLFQAHSAPLGLVFYDGIQFPEKYRGGAFVALHGSWNAAVPTGYKVVFVPFHENRPAGGYENFMTGFWASGEERARVWGRPAGLLQAADGSLLVADDAGQRIWRIEFDPEAAAQEGEPLPLE